MLPCFCTVLVHDNIDRVPEAKGSGEVWNARVMYRFPCSRNRGSLDTETMDIPIPIRPFENKDQEAVQNLIVAGLAEHWGEADPAANPDLDSIGTIYSDATFLVAWSDGRVVGTGALVPKSNQVTAIVRMSVAADMRRRGIATRILDEFCQSAQCSGFQQIIVETASTGY